MVHHIAKPQKIEEIATNNCKEAVLFNSDALSKIISYLSSVDVLNLAITCKRIGISDNDDSSVIKDSASIVVQDLATEEQLAALPRYDGESSLADYHYLQLIRAPLTFDQLSRGAEYVNDSDKSCVRYRMAGVGGSWVTAISNNILRAGKHYASFNFNSRHNNVFVGVMRPGQANENASDFPVRKEFFQHFSPSIECNNNNNSLHCGMYYAYSGKCLSSDWSSSDIPVVETWVGLEPAASGDDVGLLLDLDEGTLAVYKDGRKLGVMKSGLAGPYCWVVSMFHKDSQITIKRGTVPRG